MGLGGYNHDGEYNKPLAVVKVSIQLKKDIMKEVIATRKIHTCYYCGKKGHIQWRYKSTMRIQRGEAKQIPKDQNLRFAKDIFKNLYISITFKYFLKLCSEG